MGQLRVVNIGVLMSGCAGKEKCKAKGETMMNLSTTKFHVPVNFAGITQSLSKAGQACCQLGFLVTIHKASCTHAKGHAGCAGHAGLG